VTQIPETGAASTRVVVRVAALRFGLLNVIIIFLLSLAIFFVFSHPVDEKTIGVKNIYFKELAYRPKQLLVRPCIAGSYIWKIKKKILPWHIRMGKTVVVLAPSLHI
jgi:hypothetical protein